MPGMDGLELCKTTATERHVSINRLSSLQKPFTLTELWDSIEALLGPIPYCSNGD
jgi:hypothetical protein